MPTEIKIDRTTLPVDGQVVKWQTQEDFDNDVWKEGTFSADDGNGNGDDVFCVGFEETADKFDFSWQVLHWEGL